ncbi:hypothetical protein [Streptomyces sp. NPDC002676]
MPSNARSRGRGALSTTQRGYDGEHRKARAKALKQLQDGEPCPFCGRPMYPEQDLDYDHAVPLAVGGGGGERRLSHASCNRAAGARLGNRMRAKGQRSVQPPAPPSPPPPDGALCSRCGCPMEGGQARQSDASAFGGNTMWRHASCPIRYLSVPADRL